MDKIYKELNGLVGHEIQLIYLDNVFAEHGSATIQSRELYLKTGKGKIVKVTTKWFESRIHAVDYYQFDIRSRDDLPKSQKKAYFSFETSAPIEQVQVFTSEIIFDDETVSYESDILIRRSDDKRICICGGASAFRNLKIISTDAVIDEQLQGKSMSFDSSNRVFLLQSKSRASA